MPVSWLVFLRYKRCLAERRWQRPAKFYEGALAAQRSPKETASIARPKGAECADGTAIFFRLLLVVRPSSMVLLQTWIDLALAIDIEFCPDLRYNWQTHADRSTNHECQPLDLKACIVPIRFVRGRMDEYLSKFPYTDCQGCLTDRYRDL